MLTDSVRCNGCSRVHSVLELKRIRGRPKTTLTKFCRFLSTYLPIVDIRWHLNMYLPNVNVDNFKITPCLYYAPFYAALDFMSVWWKKCPKDVHQNWLFHNKGWCKKKFQNTFDYSNIYTRIFPFLINLPKNSHFKLSKELL